MPPAPMASRTSYGPSREPLESVIPSPPQSGRPVQDDARRSERIAAERRHEDEPLAVRSRAVPVAGDPLHDGGGEERLGDAHLELARRLDVDRHELLVERSIEELFPVRAPARVAPPRSRDLPPAAGLRKRLNVDLVAPGLV